MTGASSGTGYSPKGGATSSTASPAKPSIPSALVDRVEAYDPKLSPDNRADERELDTLIYEALGNCAHRETKYYFIEDGNDYDSGYTCVACGKDTHGIRVPAYTRSLDTALKLIPDGKHWMLQTRFNGYHAEVGWPHAGNAATPALALCAAALRARGDA